MSSVYYNSTNLIFFKVVKPNDLFKMPSRILETFINHYTTLLH